MWALIAVRSVLNMPTIQWSVSSFYNLCQISHVLQLLCFQHIVTKIPNGSSKQNKKSSSLTCLRFELVNLFKMNSTLNCLSFKQHNIAERYKTNFNYRKENFESPKKFFEWNFFPRTGFLFLWFYWAYRNKIVGFDKFIS